MVEHNSHTIEKSGDSNENADRQRQQQQTQVTVRHDIRLICI